MALAERGCLDDRKDVATPDNEEEQLFERQTKKKIGGAIATVVSTGIAGLVGVAIMRKATAGVTFNGEPLSVPGLAPVVLTVMLLAAVIYVGINRGFPGKVGGTL